MAGAEAALFVREKDIDEAISAINRPEDARKRADRAPCER
jgi:hypothetical protein